jgi:prostamide/prostaglandin F2alpha synthase
LDGARQDFKAAGVNLVLIGQGTPRQAAEFRRRQGIQLPVLADHDRVSYKAAGTKVGGVTDLFSPQTVAKGILATARTKRTQTRTIGHPSQLGGTLVIAPDARVVWSHLAQDASDNAAPDEILEGTRETAGLNLRPNPAA